MKSTLFSSSQKHQALVADINKAGRVHTQQKTLRTQQVQSPDARMTAFFNNDGFERAFAQAEALTQTSRPTSLPKTDGPHESISERLRHKRPVCQQAQALHALQPQDVSHLRGFEHSQARLCASAAHRRDPDFIAAAIASNTRPTLLLAKRPAPLSPPARAIVDEDRGRSALNESWGLAMASLTGARTKDESCTVWPPKSRL